MKIPFACCLIALFCAALYLNLLPSRFHLQALGTSQPALFRIEGEKLARAQVKCRRDMQHINKTMTTAHGVLRGNPFGDIDYFGPLRRHHDQCPRIEICLKLRQRPQASLPWIALGGIAVVAEDLKPYRLAKLSEQQG